MRNLTLTASTQTAYTFHAFAKSKASRGKLNIHMANNSTPLHRAFFIRCSSISKKRQFKAYSSMVACSGQPFAVGCVPYVAVFHPVTSYRQSVESEAIAQIIQHMELSAMIYKFLLLGTRLHVSTYAQSEAQARQFLNLSPQDAICFARIKGGALCVIS
ncbi:ash family protein [Avibacterium sp. 20-129]|uniref:ash family protein n=1 Tax=Avibacterium sp. 20-129 TaxID=2911525 RepID=UPI002247CE7A|nr:ash family protein [Avibacterium sp. 20-129]MCW9698148.1 ash family protein [Avibacterium sp. 20-129]